MATSGQSEAVRREVGQHFVVGFHGFEVDENIKTLIAKYLVGNVILMRRNVQSTKQTQELIRTLQQLAKAAGHERPLLVGIDQENGLVSAFSSPSAGTQFPGAMALAATDSVDLTERVSAASARELKMVGINWVYSPVADVNTDSRNAVIGVRSFGDDPKKVAEFASGAARGIVSERVAPTAKHFPGHGDTHVDSHLSLPVIAKTKAQLAQEELVPFKALIDAEVPCVMTGHMALPLITGNDTPCSLSKDITASLLREELRFSGVVVTDCLEMDAIAEPEQGGCGVEEGALRALKARADIAMICHTFEKQKGAVERVYRALEQGEVQLEALKESGVRIAAMKDAFTAGWDEEATYSDIHASHLELARNAYSKSTTVVWNAGNVLPLKMLDQRLLLLTPAMESVNRAVDSGDGILRGPNGVVRNTAGPSYLALAKMFEERVKTTHVVYGENDAVPTLDSVGGVVFVMRNGDLRRWQLEYLEHLSPSVPLVLVSSCGPYDLADVRSEYEGWTAYVQTFEFTAAAFEGLVSRILSDT
ncbi:unnamed protein product [Cyclocybe aegerita]|uniref:Glycoside hydrolase family 3 N-terminal domain-containing protein n=1 Tax=Cyclocybe aegerita TaxID=1973307 RepID=A0A8S0VYM9_CYCAE|nr:unnamed protein product [Cyclocybe aegerita]